MLQYAIMLEDMAMFQVNTAAIILNLAYAVFYYVYCSQKWNEILKPAALGVTLVNILLVYINYEDPELVENRYGLIMTILMLLLLGSPLLEVVSINVFYFFNIQYVVCYRMHDIFMAQFMNLPLCYF